MGAGASYKGEHFGLTGYLQYSIRFVQGRLQVDYIGQEWQPQIALGVPIPIEKVKLEPHILWSLEMDAKPKLGLRVQYQF